MDNRMNCSFKIENWEETPFGTNGEGPKLVEASVKQTYSGDLKAESVLKYLITTFNDDFSCFVGTEQVTGNLKGRAGSFILSHEGTHENGVAQSSFEIVPDSGTGALAGIHGNGSYEATHEKATFTLNYDFE